MSFVRKEDGSYDRQKFNPEDVTDGKPRVVKLHMRKSRKSKNSIPVSYISYNNCYYILLCKNCIYCLNSKNTT